jgi:hypothetical protein
MGEVVVKAASSRVSVEQIFLSNISFCRQEMDHPDSEADPPPTMTACAFNGKTCQKL